MMDDRDVRREEFIAVAKSLGLFDKKIKESILAKATEKQVKKMVDLNKIFTGKGSKRPDSEFDSTELGIGTYIEGEHTNDFEVAKRIAKDHLTEREDYYKTPLFKEERKHAVEKKGEN